MSNIWRPVDHDSLSSGLGGISGYQGDVSEVIEISDDEQPPAQNPNKMDDTSGVKVSHHKLTIYVHKHLLSTFIKQ